MKITVISIVVCAFGTVPKSLETEGIGDVKKDRNHTDHRTIMIG